MPDIRSVGQGNHICVYYTTDEQRSSIIAGYLKIGVQKNERCLCVAGQDALAEAIVALGNAGVDVDRESRRGGLLLLPPREAHLRGGRFDAEGMLKLLDDAVEQALDDGYTGLRAAGDMSWVLEGAPGTERLFEYEAMMNQFYPTSRAVGLCLYDRRLLDTPTLERALHTHPLIGMDEEVFAHSHFDRANQLRAASFDAPAFDAALESARRDVSSAGPLARARRT